MKHNLISLIGILLMWGTTSIVLAETTTIGPTPCDDYRHINMTILDYGNSIICYDLSNNGTITPPHVDSAWITDVYERPLFTCHAQSRELIDISSLNLEEGELVLVNVQIGNCVMSRLFTSRGSTTTPDPCNEYKHINMTVVNYGNRTIHYDVSNSGTITPPYVDSVWITNRANNIVVFTGHAQSGELIDISFLTRGYYALWIQIGDCIIGKQFTVNRNGTSASCEEYRTINITTQMNDDRSAMYYDLSNDDGTITPPHVDSVWITTLKDSIMLISHAQSGEWIDISSLKYERYYLRIQIGDCVLSKQFVITAPDPCRAYQNVTIAVAVAEDYSTIRYDLADEGMPITLAVDSMWITNNAVSPVVLTGHAQPGDPIDISFLRKGLYVLWVQIEECVKEGPQFRIDSPSTDLDSPAGIDTAVKILYNGQLLILRNNKVYTLQGVETRL